MEKENKELPSIMDLSIDELDELSTEIDNHGHQTEPAPEFETRYKEFAEMKGDTLRHMSYVVSNRLANLREKLQEDSEQKIWDEVRAKIQPIAPADASIEELKSVLLKLRDCHRVNHPELTYTEWLLGCLRNELEARYRLGYGTDLDTWAMRDEIRQMIEKKELLKKLNPYKSLSNEEIFEIIKYKPKIVLYSELGAWEDRIYKEYRPLEKLRRADVDNMTPEELRVVANKLWDEIYLTPNGVDEDLSGRNFRKLKIYCRYLRTYGLRDVLSEGVPLREALKDLLTQIRGLKYRRDETEPIDLDDDSDLPEEPED